MSKITKIVLDKQSDLILTNATLTTPQGLVKSDVSGLVTDLANLVTADADEAAARIAGDKRFGHPLATFMYHECLDSVPYDKMSIIKENIEETDRLMDMYDNYLISRTTLTQKQLNKVKNKKTDWYFGSDEALSYNIISHFHSPKFYKTIIEVK